MENGINDSVVFMIFRNMRKQIKTEKLGCSVGGLWGSFHNKLGERGMGCGKHQSDEKIHKKRGDGEEE